MTPGWAAELSGDAIDLSDLRLMLKHPFDPWMEDYQNGENVTPCLRTVTWNNLNSVDEVYSDAERLVKILNGHLFLLHTDAISLTCVGVLKFDNFGNRVPMVHAMTGHMRVGLVRVRAHATVVSPGQPTPRPSAVQDWVAMSNSDADRADLFASLSQINSWYNLYKSMEIMRRLKGGHNIWPRTMSSQTDRDDWKRTWTTSNQYRHAPDPNMYPPHSNPPSFEEAKNILARIVKDYI